MTFPGRISSLETPGNSKHTERARKIKGTRKHLETPVIFTIEVGKVKRPGNAWKHPETSGNTRKRLETPGNAWMYVLNPSISVSCLSSRRYSSHPKKTVSNLQKCRPSCKTVDKHGHSSIRRWVRQIFM